MTKVLSNNKPLIWAGLVLSIALFTGCKKDHSIMSEENMNQNNPPAVVVVGDPGSNINYQVLYAGQTINAGTVSYTDVDTNADGLKDALRVSYSTSNGWQLTEVQFFVGSSLSDMPVTKSGNPQVGLFPYKSNNIAGQTSYSFTIPFTTLGFTCPGPTKYFVAAHASLRKLVAPGSYQTETGWGDGQRLVERGNWAMSNIINISCDPPPPAQVTAQTETAFAYNGNPAGCFQNYSEFISNPNRWGWTNGPLTNGTYNFPIYAAAGQCDITKGTLVGNLSINYSGSTATCTYTLSGTNPSTGLPYTLKEVHLYAGAEQFPRNNQNEYTIAPGQYSKKGTGLDTQTYTINVNNLSGSIYVIAHAVVYGFPQ